MNGMTSIKTKRKRARAKQNATSKQTTRRTLATRYDALTDKSLINHWKWVDSRSVDSSLDADTRRRLRERARYEVANNSYAIGVGLAISQAVIGSGPRIQIVSSRDRETLKRIEWDFADWIEETRLAEKLRAMRFAMYQDGETFGILYTNKALQTQVKLDLRPIDCERITGEVGLITPNDVDGIRLDEYGNAVSYRVLTTHPGDYNSLASGSKYVDEADVYKASQVVHWYRKTTAEQHRGCTELASSLNLFALLRRYTLAVVNAAETAADFAAILYTDSIGDETPTPTPFETFDIERGLMMTTPEGWKVSQMKAEQPTTTYREFKREILAEIGRSLHVPLNIIAGDSSNYNYASGRLDHQEYQKSIRNDQTQCALNVMRPIFKQWYAEYSILNNLERKTPNVVFYWDGFEHVDPVKEANAQATRLEAFTTNLSIEYGKQGRDWEDELIQISRERQKMQELGLTLNSIQKGEDNEED